MMSPTDPDEIDISSWRPTGGCMCFWISTSARLKKRGGTIEGKSFCDNAESLTLSPAYVAAGGRFENEWKRSTSTFDPCNFALCVHHLSQWVHHPPAALAIDRHPLRQQRKDDHSTSWRRLVAVLTIAKCSARSIRTSLKNTPFSCVGSLSERDPIHPNSWQA